MQDMPDPCEGGNGVFCDSQDCFSSDKSEYEIWMSEPQSVKERRESFLQKMGLIHISSSMDSCEKTQVGTEDSSEMMGLDKIRDTNEAKAVPDSCFPSDLANENSFFCEGRVVFEANLAVNEEERHQEDGKTDLNSEWNGYEFSPRQSETEAKEEFQDFGIVKKKSKSLWKHLLDKMKRQEVKLTPALSKPKAETSRTDRLKVRQNKKRWMEFSAVYMGQEIKAHRGLIWTMKFSPDGQYLASGSEDGVVRVWRVTSLDTSTAKNDIVSMVKEEAPCSPRPGSPHFPIVIPHQVLQIEESPYQEFHGHSSDVLDLAWSSSNLILSSSKDKTVCLWQLGSNQCLNVFHHKDYVTCIQFHPVDENYFISGSIDGKVRIWGVSEKRVVDWIDTRTVITAISYHPNGKKFIVGCVRGICRIYVVLDNHIQLEAQIRIHGKKKTSCNKITGIQFCHDKWDRVMITSEDSKVRIFEGLDIVHKCRGLPKSGSQMSASFSPSKKHIISVGEDSHVYIWNFDHFASRPSKRKKSISSCEYFFSKGVTVAIPWAGQKGLGSKFTICSSQRQHQFDGASRTRESPRFSLANWFTMDGLSRGSLTWPEEKLPPSDVTVAQDEYYQQHHDQFHQQVQVHCHKKNHTGKSLPETWEVAIVTADQDGNIKTFHNFGFPVRL